MRRMGVVASCLTLALLTYPIAATAQGQPAETQRSSSAGPRDILSAVPADAWAFVCAPNIGKMDARLTALVQRLNLPMMMGSPLMMAKMMLGLTMGFDDTGALAAVLMPMSDLSAPGKFLVILLPTTSYEELMSVMNPEPAEGGISKTYFFMQKESYVAPYGKWAALAQNPETLAAFLKAAGSVKSRFNDHQLKRLQMDDLTLWLNASAITSSDLFAAFAPMLAMSAMDPEMIKQFTSVEVSLRFDPAGLNVGYYFDAKPDSEIGKSFRLAPATTDSLLKGLPKEPFVLAMGGAMSKAQGEMSAGSIDKVLAMLAMKGGNNAAAMVESLGPMIKYLLSHIRQVSMSVSGLPPEQDGMIAITVLLTTEGKSEKVCQTIGEMVGSIKAILAQDEEAAELVELVSYKPAAETSGSVQVDHFSFELPLEVDGEDRQKAIKILGKEGILLRVAPVTDRRVAITFGGGSERLAQVVKAAQSDAAPLASDEGIQRVSAFMAKKRSAEGYLAVDRLIAMIGEIAKSAGKPFVVTMPEINAPIAFVTAPAGNAGSQNDVFVPMEAIVAVKDAVINAIGQKMNAPAPSAQTQEDL